MKKHLATILKILLLVIPFIMLAVFVESVLVIIPNNYTVKRDYLEANLSNIETLILGSSHTFHGIAPKYLGSHTFNLAYASQDLYYDSKLLDRYINKLPKLKTVILEASYFSLEYSIMDIDEDWRSFFYYRVYGIPIERNKFVFDIRKVSYALLYKKDATLRYLFSQGKNPEVTLHSDGWDMLGSGGGCTTGESRATFHTSIMHRENISLNLKYMQKMADLLKKRGVKLIITSPPVCTSYFNHMDKQRYQTLRKEIIQFSRKNNAPYLDYMNDPEFTEEDFIDSDHLGIQGAIKFSRDINAHIQSVK